MTTTSKSSLYFHIIAIYRIAKQPWDEKNPLTHITIRKGYYKSEDDAFSSAVSILTDHISNLEELCPKKFICNKHSWKDDWWAAPDFLNAHNYLLDVIKLVEPIPRWLEKDIKNSDDPEKTRQTYRNALTNYGTPWDGEECFNMIAHMTKVNDLHKIGDELEFDCIAIFDGKSNRGQLFPTTPHKLFNH